MKRLINRWLCGIFAGAALLLIASAPASAHGAPGRDHDRDRVVRAALAPFGRDVFNGPFRRVFRR
jgi:hypothetical protein